MVTKPERGPEPDTIADEAERALRNAIAGHPQGAIRRIVLYAIMFGFMGAAHMVPDLIVVPLVCACLLIATDNLL